MTTIRNNAVTASGNPPPILTGSTTPADASPFSALLQQHAQAVPEPVAPPTVQPERSADALAANRMADRPAAKVADKAPAASADKTPDKVADQADAPAGDKVADKASGKEAGKSADKSADKGADKADRKDASPHTAAATDKTGDKTSAAHDGDPAGQAATDPLAAWLAALHGGAAGASPATASDSGKGVAAHAQAGEALSAVAGEPGLPAELGGTKLVAQAGDASGFAAALAAHGRGAEAGANALGLAAVRMLGAGADASALQGLATDAGAGIGNHLAADAAAQAAALGALGGTGAAASAAAHGLDAPTVAAPVGSAGFANELADQVQVLVSKAALDAAAGSVHEARLNLNPAEMGPIAIRIALDGKHAQVDFAAASGATRQALQDSMPALASALHGAGLTLSGGGVSQQFAHAQQQSRQPGEARATGVRGEALADGDASVQDITSTVASWVRQPEGRLDLYV